MARYEVTYTVPLNLTVTVETDETDEDRIEDVARPSAVEYLNTIYGNRGIGVFAEADLDGIGYDEIMKVEG